MIKVISAKAMAQLELTAYNQGYSSSNFMENAGKGVAEFINKHIIRLNLPKTVLLLCGKGNNAGDAFVAAIHLLEKGYQIYAIQPEPIENCSTLCQLNRKRCEQMGAFFYNKFKEAPRCSVILDGIFGTGFKGKVQEPYASLILAANQSQIPIFSIDIPSGLDGNTGQIGGIAVKAQTTIFLSLPKTGFFYHEGWNQVGHLQAVNFGLPYEMIETTAANFELINEAEIAYLLPPIKRNRHKYQAGFVAGLAGSLQMPGASMLSSLATLRGGSGIVKLFHPQGMEVALTNSPYELIKISYEKGQWKELLEQINKADATFVGPGLGRTAEVQELLKNVIPHLIKPCVMDADALSIFAEQAFNLPSQVIMTPHTGEMQKLLHRAEALIVNEELLLSCQEYVEDKRVTLILKGAPTFIFHPGTPILVNPTGDPGMATAGSGDVLTGLLAALLSQGLDCREAACLGVYLHGLAGELAAQKRTSYGVIATDLIECFGEAFRCLQNSFIDID